MAVAPDPQDIYGLVRDEGDGALSTLLFCMLKPVDTVTAGCPSPTWAS